MRTEEHNAKISAGMMGHNVSSETRRKISIAAKKRRHTLETRKKLSKYWIGDECLRNGRIIVKISPDNWKRRSHLVWEKNYGPIPQRNIIHHHNENPLDDRIENLRCWTQTEHKAHHLPHRRKKQ